MKNCVKWKDFANIKGNNIVNTKPTKTDLIVDWPQRSDTKPLYITSCERRLLRIKLDLYETAEQQKPNVETAGAGKHT